MSHSNTTPTQNKSPKEIVPESLIRILTYNICMIPEYVPYIMGNNLIRANLICNIIIDNINNIDIICLQELFDKNIKEYMVSRLSSYYPFYILDNSSGKYWIGVNSGLAIFSKYIFYDPKLITYNLYRGVAESFANKGALCIRLRLATEYHHPDHENPNSDVYIINTHLQTDDYASDHWFLNLWGNTSLSPDDIRLEQIKQLKNIISKHSIPLDRHIICGDFNIINPFYYNLMQNLIGIRDTFQRTDFIHQHYSIPMHVNMSQTSNDNNRIDYILSNLPSCNSHITDDFLHHSDHHAVIATLQCN